MSKSVLFAALGMVSVAAAMPLATASAQSSTTGAIGGTVTDTGGALLPNTAITVRSTETGVTRQAKSSSAGEYKIEALQPGTYTVTYVADGFQKLEQTNVVVAVGNLSTLSPKLMVGSVSDKIEVTDQAPEIKTTGADIATTIDQSTIDNLPINGRRYSDFALLTPGVVSNSDGFGLLSFRGISYLLNNVTVDGADNNQAYFSEAAGRTRSSYTVTQGAVQEFQVNTSNYSAEYGRAAGGVINTVTKSGSNQLHGEVFFYDRDNGVGGAANPYTENYNFSESTGLNLTNIKPKDERLQYGFGVGGPLLRNRLFWFYAFDQQKRKFPGLSRTTDPYDTFALSAPQLSGQESCTTAPGTAATYGAPSFTYVAPDGTVYSSVSVTANLSNPTTTSQRLYPIGQSYQGDYAACALTAAINSNYQSGSAYYNQGLGVMASFFGVVPRFGNQTINFPKLDWQINDRNRMTVQYNRLRWDSPNGIQTQSSNFYGRGSFGNDFVKTDAGIFRLSSVLSNTVVNQFLGQYARDDESEFPSTPTPNEQPLSNALPQGECSAPHGGPCAALPPDVSIGYGFDAAGFDIGTSSILTRFALPDERRIQLRDDLTWSRGAHTFKFGLDYNKVSDFINNLYNGYGNYSYDWSYGFIGDYLHATTGLGGSTYAGGPTANLGLYSSLAQGFTVPANYVPANGNAPAQGTPDNYGASALLTTREYAGYATDDWRITPRLTITAGVRYEYQYVPANPTPNPYLAGNASIGGDAAFFQAAGVAVPNTTSRPDDRNNIQPRMGFAWNISGDSKTVLRGGYGIYFGRLVNANIVQSYQNSGGPRSQVNIAGVFPDPNSPGCAFVFPKIFSSYTTAATCAQPTSAGTTNASSHPSVSYLDPHLQNPQVHEADLDLQQNMGKGFVLGITYMASFGRELDSASDVNVNLQNKQVVNFLVSNNSPNGNPASQAVALPHGGKPPAIPQGYTSVQNVVYGSCPKLNAPANCAKSARYDPNYYRILRIASNVNSNYNALAFQLNKRFSNGFSLLTNFTWAHALDFNPYIGTGVPGPTTLDPNNQRKDYGNSSLDVRRRFVAALVYQPQTHFHGVTDALLGGWRIAPETQIQSGLPYTPYTSGQPGESVSGIRSPNGAGGTSGRLDFFERNQYTRPKTAKLDVRVGKNFYIPVHHYSLDNVRLEFFAELFNVFNHQNITGIQTTAYNLSSVAASAAQIQSGQYPSGYIDTVTSQPNFGTYTNSNSNYVYSPRQLQLAARLHF